MPAAVHATTIVRHANLDVDRTERPVDPAAHPNAAAWDEAQGTIRPTRGHAPATFAQRRELLGGGADRCGTQVSTGDLNGDGLVDLVSGCPADFTAEPGRVQVYLRNASDTGYTAGASITPPLDGMCGLGFDIGDGDGDGDLDLAIGCWTNGATPCPFGICAYVPRGTVYFVPNAGNGTFGAPVLVYTPAARTGCGFTVAFASLDNNAAEDLLIGCGLHPISSQAHGSVEVFRYAAGAGVSTSWHPQIQVMSPTPATNEQCSVSIATGDFNGDSRDDFAFGCIGDSSFNGSAVIAINDGNGTGFATEATELRHPTPGTQAHCGAEDSLATGDLDADGMDDVVLGCRGTDAGLTDQGSAVVFYRRADGTGFRTAPGEPVVLTVPWAAASDGCGQGVGTGDFNGDGQLDVVMGCPGDDLPGAADAGSSVTFARNGAGTGFEAAVLGAEFAPGANRTCGFSTIVDDVNGDGRDDVVLGCQGGAGRISVVDGAGLPIADGETTPASGARCGGTVTTGDFNGDGLGDLAYGCPSSSVGAASAGAVVVRLRTADNRGYGAQERLGRAVARSNDFCGESVATGDVNGDGLDDIAYSCTRSSLNAGLNVAGEVFVHLRASSGLAFGAAKSVSLPAGEVVEGNTCGAQLAFVDVDGDDRDEIAWSCDGVGASTSAGGVLVSQMDPVTEVFGAPIERLARPAPNAGIAGDNCGRSGLAVGDVDGDGRLDIAFGCSAASGGTSVAARGSVVVFRRTTANTGYVPYAEVADPSPADGKQCASGGTTGPSSSLAVGDIDGNGLGDLVIGCRGATGNRGEVLVALGAGGGSFTVTALPTPAPVAGEYCGVSVAAGDVNGDGRDDVAMGCSSNRLVASAVAGRIVTFTRDAANGGYDGAVGVIHPSAAGINNCGSGLAVRDVDADGRADLVFGCNRVARGGTATAGGVVVVNSTAPSTRSSATPASLDTRRISVDGESVSAVTVSAPAVRNGAAALTFSASADGGSTWESVTAGVPHVFAAPGWDLRVRVSVPAAPVAGMVPVLHDLFVTYERQVAPSAPALNLPADGANTPVVTPQFRAVFTDADAGDTGTVTFEVCRDATAAPTPVQACTDVGGVVAATGSSATGIAIGALGQWSAPTLLADTPYHWRARSTDNGGAVGSWSAAFALHVDATMSVNVGVATAGMDTIEAASDGTASSTLTVASNDPGGYDVLARDGSNTTSMVCLTPASCGTSEIPDWSGTAAAPTPWAPEVAGPSGYAGVAVTAATSGLDPRWVPVGPDFDQPYAGLDTTARVLHRSATTATADTVELTWRFTPSMATLPGSYRSTVVVTVVGAP